MPESTNTLKCGDVITIEGFNMPRIGDKVKMIWAVYLGKDGIFDTPIITYFQRTTTQIDDFKPGGNRERHKCKVFKKGQFGFVEDCVIDFNEKPFTNTSEEKFNSFIIEKKGRLPDHILKELYSKTLKHYLNKPQLVSIRNSYAEAGIKIK